MNNPGRSPQRKGNNRPGIHSYACIRRRLSRSYWSRDRKLRLSLSLLDRYSQENKCWTVQCLSARQPAANTLVERSGTYFFSLLSFPYAGPLIPLSFCLIYRASKRKDLEEKRPLGGLTAGCFAFPVPAVHQVVHFSLCCRRIPGQVSS